MTNVAGMEIDAKKIEIQQYMIGWKWFGESIQIVADAHKIVINGSDLEIHMKLLSNFGGNGKWFKPLPSNADGYYFSKDELRLFSEYNETNLTIDLAINLNLIEKIELCDPIEDE